MKYNLYWYFMRSSLKVHSTTHTVQQLPPTTVVKSHANHHQHNIRFPYWDNSLYKYVESALVLLVMGSVLLCNVRGNLL